MFASMSSKAWCWVGVGVARTSMVRPVTVVVLRVRVFRWSSRPRKLRAYPRRGA